MYKDKSIENLEIKLKNARESNEKAFEKFEKIYLENYKKFVENIFKTDILWVKKIIWAVFQLELLNGKQNNEAFQIAVEKATKTLPLSVEKKEKLKNKILKLENKKQNLSEIFIKNNDLKKDKNFPIIESLFERKILDNSDLLVITSEFSKKWNIKNSLNSLVKEKKEIIKEYIYLSNWINKEEKINSFKSEYYSELKEIEKKYPSNIIDWVVKFVWRSFFKMKPYKKNLESRKLRLKRTFKIALLRLLRIKYRWYNIEELVKKINSMQDFESMFKLIMKLIDIIPENDELLEKFSLAEEADEVESLISESEKNKEKILDWEESTIKICELLDETDKKLDKKTLDKLLDDDIDIIWNEIKVRWKKIENANIWDWQNVWNLLDWWTISKINSWILISNLESNNSEWEEDDDEEEIEELTTSDLEIIYNEIKLDFSILDKQKLEYLINDDFENLWKTIDKLAKIQIKLEKIEKLLI